MKLRSMKARLAAAGGATALAAMALVMTAPAASAAPIPGSPGYASARTASADITYKVAGNSIIVPSVATPKMEANGPNEDNFDTTATLGAATPLPVLNLALVTADVARADAISTPLLSEGKVVIAGVTLGLDSNHPNMVHFDAKVTVDAQCPVGGTPTATVLVETIPAGGTPEANFFSGSGVVPTGSIIYDPAHIDNSVWASLSFTSNAAVITANSASISGSKIFLTVNPDANNQLQAIVGLGDVSCVTPTAPVPTASAITPPSGPTSGGTPITITGTNFVAGSTTVTIGGVTVPAGSVTVNSATSLTFNSPAEPAGLVNVVVTTPGGPSTPALHYTYLPVAPVITAPVAGSTTGSPFPPISGTGTPGDTVVVSENGTTLCTALVGGDGTWSCTPATAMGESSHTIIAVQTLGNLTGPASASVTFTVANIAASVNNTLASTGTQDVKAARAALVVILIGTLMCAGAAIRRRRLS
jgi:hypothetical protein